MNNSLFFNFYKKKKMNSSTNKVKYVFIGHGLNLKVIGENISTANSVWSNNAQRIFREYCKNIETKYEKNNKIVSEDGVYFLKISPSNIFYLALMDNSYPERRAFQMIDDIIKDNIHLLVDEKGELNKPGKQALKTLIKQYENDKHDKISELSGDINDIKIEMQNNVKKVLGNTDNLQDLDAKAVKIKDNANMFKKDAVNLKKKTCLQNLKWTIILVAVIVILLLIVIVPIVTSIGSSDKRKSDNLNDNPPPPPHNFLNSTMSGVRPSGSGIRTNLFLVD